MAFRVSTNLKAGPLGLTVSLPFYSDEYFEEDFLDRSEDMDLFSLASDTTTTTTVSTRSSFTQSLSLTYSLKPELLSPWLSSIDITKLGASMAWLAKYNTELYNSDQKAAVWLHPVWRGSRAVFFLPQYSSRPWTRASALKEASFPRQRPHRAIRRMRTNQARVSSFASPWVEAETEEKQDASAASGEPALKLPARIPSFAQSSSSTAGALSLDWSLTPTAYIETALPGRRRFEQHLEPRLARPFGHRFERVPVSALLIQGFGQPPVGPHPPEQLGLRLSWPLPRIQGSIPRYGRQGHRLQYSPYVLRPHRQAVQADEVGLDFYDADKPLRAALGSFHPPL